jgi:pimeloyl-ACP methyl ester carboxylesterase
VSCLPSVPCRTVRPDLDVRPWQERSVRSETSGHTYRYLFAAGPHENAPAVLLLHGGIFDNRIWLNSVALGEKFNVYALQWPDNSLFYTGNLSDYGEIARDFLLAIGVEEVFVAGVSMGVSGAIELAVHPSGPKIKALILCSGVMHGINDEEIEKRTATARRALGFSPERLRAIVDWRATRSDYDPAPGAHQMIDLFYTRPYPYYYQIFTAALNQGARRQATEKIACPVLFLNGTGDDIMLIHVARLNPTVFEDATFVEFDGYKHAMVYSKGPELVGAVFDFLEKRGLLSPNGGAN